jgi:DNA-binding CsgD family transcriptional regulator
VDAKIIPLAGVRLPGLPDEDDAPCLGFFGVPQASMEKYGNGPHQQRARVVEVSEPEQFIKKYCSGVLVASLRAIIQQSSVVDMLRLYRPAQLLVYLDTEQLAAREARVLSLLEGVSVIGPGTHPADFARVVQLARSGISSAPASLRRSLTVYMPDRLGYDDVTLLLRLVRGQSVDSIATDMGCSEPQVQEQLTALYDRLGVVGRDGALHWSHEHGMQ